MSQQFPVADSQMLEIHVSEELGMPVSDVQMVMVTHPPKSQELLEFSMPDGQIRSIESLVQGSTPDNAAKSNYQTMQVDRELGFHESLQFVNLNHGFGEDRTYSSAPIPSLLSKRKAEMEPLNVRSGFLPSSVPNKRVTQMLSISPPGGSVRPLGMSKKVEQMQSKLISPTTQKQTPNRKMGTNDFGKSNSQRVQAPKGKTTPITPTSKVSRGSSDAVRSKMKESLAAALELACSNQETSASGEAKKTQNATDQNTGVSQPQSDTSVSGVASDNFEDTKNSSSTGAADKPSDCQRSATLLSSGDNSQESDCFKEFRLDNEDVSYTDNFFTKDELLQGNGLTWAWDMDMGSSGMDEVLTDVNEELAPEDGDMPKHEEARKSPLDLAHEIEGELFKLHGGVNKKYREKGRSLLFNLKDCNNPELRERVMSGTISPERLCSMTAEELASKELSEWRMAKAEELAQMVVLPDTDVNMRRMVRKTHKGEYEVERADDISMEVKEEERPAHIPAEDDIKDKDDDIKDKDTVPKSGPENHEISGRLIIPNEGTDLMHGMIVDEMKDADFLPPIVSLDEFMECLDSEPPFENLPVDAIQTMGPLEKGNGEAGGKVVSTDVVSSVPAEKVSDKTEKEVEKDKEQIDQHTAEKAKESPVVQKIAAPESRPPVEVLWQGSLQLSISSSVGVLGTFKSGEKTSTKEWPASLEVKGRVRLDAFKKFLKDLPMSRSRAVMVVHFSLEDSTLEDEKATLSEAVESYVSDERLGFAEPTSGVELYLCPPKSRIADMLIEHVSKNIAEILNSTDNGLIGIVVWRKAHLSSSTISPNSSSHHKDGLKRQHSARKQQEKDANVSKNYMSKGSLAQSTPKPPPPPPKDDDDDDIPPGFGPGATRDDDDLPEFNFPGNANFSGNVKPSMGGHSVGNSLRQPTFNRPVEHMRQLVQKYGQTTETPSRNSGNIALGLEPWEDDDDDDIPEWRPQLPNQNYPSHPEQVHSNVIQQFIQRNVGRPIFTTPPQYQGGGGQNMAPAWQQGSRYAPPGGVPNHVNLANMVVPGQQQQVRLPVQGALQPSLDWRHGTPRSRAL